MELRAVSFCLRWVAPNPTIRSQINFQHSRYQDAAWGTDEAALDHIWSASGEACCALFGANEQ